MSQWPIVKLGDVAELITDGVHNSPEYVSSGIPMLDTKHIGSNFRIDDTQADKFISAETDAILAKRCKPQANDILLSSRGSIGKIAIVDSGQNFNIMGNMILIRPPIGISSKLLALILKMQVAHLQNIAQGVAQKGLYLGQIRNLQIPLPPLDIQKQIVARLEMAQTLIDQRKQQLGLMDSLIQSTFYEMFGDQANNEKGWDVKPLPFFLSVDTNMIHDFTDYQDFPHIGIDSIEKNTGKIANYRTINEDGVISGKYLFDQRHIIYSKIRPNLNKVALPTFQGLCSADAYPLLVDSSKANRVFVALILRSEHFLNEIMAHCTRTNIPKINKKQLLSFESILPPIDLQNTFSDRVQKFEKIKAQMTASLAELEQNFNALMQQSFAG